MLSSLLTSFFMSELLTTDQLIAEVREATKELSFNGRIDAQLSERTIRYYVTMKFLSPPQRHNRRAMWTNDHIDELIRIRRAQSAGTSLKEIGESLVTDSEVPWRLANRGVMRSQMIDIDRLNRDVEAVKAKLTIRQQPKGWSLRLSQDITLSGFTALQPSTEELHNVIAALSRIIPE